MDEKAVKVGGLGCDFPCGPSKPMELATAPFRSRSGAHLPHGWFFQSEG